MLGCWAAVRSLSALLKSLGTGASKDPRTLCGSVSFNFLNCFEGCQAEQTASGATAQPHPCYPGAKAPDLGTGTSGKWLVLPPLLLRDLG